MMIRQAISTDIPVLTQLIGQLFALEPDFTVDPAKQKRGLELLMASSQCAVLVAEEAGNVVGLVIGQLVISTSEGAHSVWIEDMMIHPDHRKKGYATLLLDALKNWGRRYGATRFQLLADVKNQGALDFYQKKGWQETRLKALRLGGV